MITIATSALGKRIYAGRLNKTRTAFISKEHTMQRRSFTFSGRHDSILTTVSKKLDLSMTETLQRALEALEEKEAARDREVNRS